ncbi:putative ABC transport system permease protein [Parabacteroides sp. PF5-5]|uniref:ABC transporter permease n=1 Tax=unclassified Parabacteroides TaxID=2649774 RepID=UPI0024764930|nr:MULTISPECIES: ABC transporter permease [unclassified Parabacteroides]MDH6304548.1 putative ABC transport system permease protein [Parabacteroides sp. PH5-39]MDH6315300.1 putative ABC transport system permease protein [Parabacteroides sp. PF5-13]MDH6319206.1 putative ABC transport system permease protein [Parabacteroides sp. PH5-13]MDH6322937.1 putative ABC transport system permease protein [Parabacteroides sp. PH5-8]MDH6326491.1 putative ABC transport system permease protein [Parabacteroide
MKTILRNFLSVLRRFKMATVLNVLGLSVAFAAFTVIMIQVTYDLGFDKSIKDADTIYRLEMVMDGRRVALVSWPFHEDFASASPHILSSTMANTMFTSDFIFKVDKQGTKQSYSEKMFYALPDYPDFFHFQMVEGTAKALEDPNKVLLPESMARRIFGNEPALDKQLIRDDKSFTVGGVYKDFPKNSSVHNYIIQQLNKKNNTYYAVTMTFASYLKLDRPESVKGLVEDIIPLLDLTLLNNAFEGEINYHLTALKDIHYDMAVEFDTIEKTSKQTVWILIAIGLVILIIAGINFTNYNMALTPLRIKSINTQKVLGASQATLRRTLLLEAVGICFLSWLISVGLVYLLSLTSVSSLLDADMALSGHIPLLGAIAAISLLLGLFAGLYPSWYITSFAPAMVLKGTFGLSPQGRSLRNSLMGVQFVASFILIVAALFMYLQNNYMRTSPVGYEKDQIIVTDMSKQLSEKRVAFVNELKLQAGITDVGFTDILISSGDDYTTQVRELKGHSFMFQQIAVDLDFLKMMNIEVFDGRDFTRSDQNDTIYEDHFIFNRRAKEEFELAVGDKLKDKAYGEDTANDIVVGFIPDINVASLRNEILPMAFSLIKENRWPRRNWAYIKVKAGSDMYAAMDHVKATLQDVSPDYPFKVKFFNDVINDLYIKERSLTSLITWFSLIAVLISIVGVFGLVVFESEYKRKEVGVRKVLGSTTAEILAMFNKRYVRILTVCFIVAAPIAWYAVHTWLQSFAYKTPMYWWVFALSFLIVTMITTATVTFQSWQVANANPVDSIKTE